MRREVSAPHPKGRQIAKISELNTIQGGTATPYSSSSLPFCVRFNAPLRVIARIGTLATLDTEPLARGYSGGIPTRSSSNHFQSARNCSRPHVRAKDRGQDP